MLIVLNGLLEVNGVLGGFFVHPRSGSKRCSDATVASATSGGTERDTDRFHIPLLVMLWSGQAD